MRCLLTRYHKWALSWLSWSYFTSLHSLSVTSIMILSYHMCLVQMVFVLQFAHCNLYILYFLSPLQCTCLDHPSLILPYCQFLLNISSEVLRLLFSCYILSVWIWISKKTKHLQMLTSSCNCKWWPTRCNHFGLFIYS